MKKIQGLIYNSKTRTKILLIFIVAIITIISYGVYLKYNFGEIKIAIPYQGSSIFLDGIKTNTTIKDNQIVTLSKIYPGEHSILVYTKNHYPWKKTINIKKDTTVKMYPFLMIEKLTENHSDVIMKLTKKEISTSKTLFEKQNGNLISNDGKGNVEIKKENTNILAAWIGKDTKIPDFFCNKDKCTKLVTVFTSKIKPIKKIAFYPNRNDVVIFLIGNSIYAIGISKNGVQNFQPIYTGDNPDFAVENKGSILYIKDGNLEFGIALHKPITIR